MACSVMVSFGWGGDREEKKGFDEEGVGEEKGGGGDQGETRGINTLAPVQAKME